MAKAKTTPAADDAKKSPVTRDQFRKGAKPIMVKVGETTDVAAPKEFATGTLGWFTNGKAVIDIDGVPCKVTFQVQVFVVNSKEAK